MIGVWVLLSGQMQGGVGKATRQQAADETNFVLGPRQLVIADVSEDWTTPVDRCIQKLGGKVYRRARRNIRDALAGVFSKTSVVSL